jgi:thiamine biosynthesis lipoprotein
MGTQWSVTWIQPGSVLPEEKVRTQVAARLEELEAMFSTYRTNSVISRFNAHASDTWFSVPGEVVAVARAGLALSQETNGAFDLTVAPLVNLWGFGSEPRASGLPGDAEIARALARVAWQKLEVHDQPPALRKADPQLAVDFSSIAKGFAADEVSAVLLRLGAERHLVQIGGDVRSAGDGGGAGWALAIERASELPGVAADAAAIAATVRLTRGAALSTSGNYRNAIEHRGRRLGHIIDPRTGWPVESGLVAVSVVASSCAQSSALATALFVLGPDAGWRFAQERGVAALFQLHDGGRRVLRANPAWKAIGSEAR